MKNFTLSILCTLAAFFSTATAMAQTTIADVFGKYEFSCKIELTAEGQQYADIFKDKCEVNIGPDDDNIHMASVSPIAGAVESHCVNKFENNTLYVYNPNEYNTGCYWEGLSLANANGDSPYDWNKPFEFQYVYDAETGNLTMPDFTAVQISGWGPDDPIVIMAKFTECKLTLIEKIGLEIADLSGEYEFLGKGSNEESSIGAFSFTMTATSEDFKTYTTVITFPGFQPVTIEGCTFDGQLLYWPINKTYLDTEVPYVFATMYPTSATGNITWQNPSEGKLTLYSGMVIAKVVDAEKELEDGTVEKYQKLVTEQWYTSGTAKNKNVETPSIAGTYKVKSNYAFYMIEDEKDKFPAEFAMTIEEGDYGYYVTEFMGRDTYTLNMGGIPCKLEDNVLKIETGTSYSFVEMGEMDEENWSWIKYYVLYGPIGDNAPVTITINSDGTLTMSDFFICRATANVVGWDYVIDESTKENVAYFGENTIEKMKVELAGTHKVTYAGTPNVFSGNGTWPTEFNVVVEEYEGEYYVTEFMGFDTFTMNYGGIPCKKEGDNVLKIEAGGYSSYLDLVMGEVDPELGWANPTSFVILYNAEGKEGDVTLTVNLDGTATISDFVIMHQDYATQALSPIVAYGSYVPDAIQSVAGINTRSQIFDLNGKRMGSNLQNLPKGVYVVKRGGKAVKVAK